MIKQFNYLHKPVRNILNEALTIVLGCLDKCHKYINKGRCEAIL